MKKLVNVGAKKKFDPSILEHESTFSTQLNESNNDEINALMKRDWTVWTNIDNSLMTKFNQLNQEFKTNYVTWIKWHIKVIQGTDNAQHNETVEQSIGIDVPKKTLTLMPTLLSLRSLVSTHKLRKLSPKMVDFKQAKYDLNCKEAEDIG